MSSEFPRVLSLLRQERGVSQRTAAKDLGISPTLAMDALLCSRDIRDKYTTSALLWDLGLLYREDLWGPCL